jgi:hypothetical protein
MKLNPYPVLVTIGVLMLATVVLAQTGTGASLVKAGVVSLNRDVSSFAVRTWSSLQSRVLVADEPPESDVARHPESRLAAVEKTPADRDAGRALEE